MIGKLLVVLFCSSILLVSAQGPEGEIFSSVIRNFHNYRDDLLFSLLNHGVVDISGYEKLQAVSSHKSDLYSERCDSCVEFIDTLNVAFDLGLDYPTLRPIVIDLCMDAMNSSNQHGDIMCPGLMDNYGPHVEAVMRARPGDAEEICVWGNDCGPDDIIPPDQRQPYQPRPRQTSTSTKLQISMKRPDLENALKVVQLTDIHVDPEYTQGSASSCGLLVCCRDKWNGTGSARPHGDRSCNIPPTTVELFLNFTKNLNPEYVLHTGDNNPGALWEETVEHQDRQNKYLADTFARLLGDIPAYPVIGNHETMPTNLYHIGRPEIQDLNVKFAEWWNQTAHFPEDQIANLHYAGYYQILLQPGLRLLAYNSNYGYVMNWYNRLNENGTDYQDMKDFMETTLSTAKQNQEKVLLVGHHPTGDGDSLNYYAEHITGLVDRYEDIIILHPFGHYHRDEIKLVYNAGNQKAVGVEYLMSSMTTGTNPGMRVYYFDRDTFELLDYDNFNLDIDAAGNLPPDLSLIQRTYRATEEYGLTDLSPESWADMVDRMETDDALLQKYYQNRNTRTNPGATCDAECKKDLLCTIRNPVHAEYRRCMAA